jgi:antitoxin component YwqK of YwqJK toxin-antitoxin module
LSLKGYFDKDGYQVGQWIRWFPNGHRKSISYYSDSVREDDKGLNPLDQITLWDDTYRELNAFFYYGAREGRWTITSSTGNLLFVLNYTNSLDKKYRTEEFETTLEGVLRYYYDNGQLQEEHNYHLNESHGLFTSWHDNGQKRSEVKYKNGKIDGDVTNWNSSGKKTSSERFYRTTKPENFDWHWNNPEPFTKRTIEQAISAHFKEDADVTYVQLESSLSVIAKREEEKRRQRYSGISSSRSSVDEDGFSWLDKQALTDDEKLLGESFWRGIL